MAGTKRRVREGLTLEEFLQLPEEKPYLEYIDGRIEAKVSPQYKHSLLQTRLADCLNQFAGHGRLGWALTELRCTFGGRSIIPDVVFIHTEHIELDDEGEPIGHARRPPDLHIEIISPEQSVRKAERKLEFSVAQGCLLGWIIHPEKKTVMVYRAGRDPETMGLDGTLDGNGVLPGFQLGVANLFALLKLRREG